MIKSFNVELPKLQGKEKFPSPKSDLIAKNKDNPISMYAKI